MNDVVSRLEGSINKETTGGLAINGGGAMAFRNMNEIMEAAKMMATAGVAIPKHLRANPGACLSIVMQASEWGMSPFAVANKSYSVSDRVSYEAQLIQAVINMRAPIKGRMRPVFTGEGPTRQCTATAIDSETGETVEYTSPMLKDIGVKNSPLWKNDPDQQLWYYSARSFARRHYPEVLLGVYEKEELANGNIGPDNARDVTPGASMHERMAAKAREQAEPVEPVEPKSVDKVGGDTPQTTSDDEAFRMGWEAQENGFFRDDAPSRGDDEGFEGRWLEGFDASKAAA